MYNELNDGTKITSSVLSFSTAPCMECYFTFIQYPLSKKYTITTQFMTFFMHSSTSGIFADTTKSSTEIMGYLKG